MKFTLFFCNLIKNQIFCGAASPRHKKSAPYFPAYFLRLSLGLLALSLNACQGSNLGSSLENAIAPVNPTEDAAPKSTEPTPKPSPSVIQTVKPTSNPTLAPTITATATPETIKLSPSPTSSPSFTPKSSDRSISQTSKPESLSNQLIAIALQALPKSTTPQNPKSLKAFFSINFANSPNTSTEFTDLEQAPAALRDWIQDLQQLGTISAKTGQLFQPNAFVARREYARWLLQTNNRFYKNQPSRQIRLAQPSDTPSFLDIPNNHPDFAIIQGLANAGLIGGTGDRFRPNDPILREELVQWKIPLDLRQPLPSATWEGISQTWGFKDTDRISDSALSAIFADAQLRDLANIRRSFGFTTILQPQKPVTRAEAAASLWYFGTATDGISANKVLEQDQRNSAKSSN